MLALVALFALQDVSAKVTLEDGSTLNVKIWIKSVTVSVDGKDETVAINKVKKIVLGKASDELVTADKTIKGKIAWEGVKANSEVGMLTLWREHVKEIEITKVPETKPVEKPKDEPVKTGADVNFGINDPEHETRCFLGGGRMLLDFEQSFKLTQSRFGYFFNEKAVEEGMADGFYNCKQCRGFGWIGDRGSWIGTYKADEKCPKCGESGSVGIWKDTMRMCIHCGHNH
jgi:hypothetical protein